MKVTVDVTKIYQEWDPKSGHQSNKMDIAFAGRTFTFEVSEEQLVSAIVQLKKSHGEHEDHPVYTGVDYAEEPDYSVVAVYEAPETEEAGAEDLSSMFQKTEEEVVAEEQLASFLSIGENAPLPAPRPAPKPSAQALRRAMIAAKPHLAGKTLGKGGASLVVPPDAPKSEQQLAAERQAALRKRAREVPSRTVPKDEMGYPVVPASARHEPNGANHGVEAVHRQPVVPVNASGDEDGFAQG